MAEHVEQPNLEHEHERRSNTEAQEQLSLRAEYVIRKYLADHPDSELRKLVEEQVIDVERAYRVLTDQARDPKVGIQRSDVLRYILEYEMYLRRDTGQPFTVGFYDLDDFGRINKELDHVTGDRVLQRAATLMAKSVRQTDDVLRQTETVRDEASHVSRFGGEEFVIIYSNTNAEDAQIPAERLRALVDEQLRDVWPDGRPITVSGGLVEYDPANHKDWESILRAGSQLVKTAKMSGKNTIATFVEPPLAEAA